MAHALRTTLRLFLALVLGLGPLGASVLAAAAHAPLCGCTGCGASAASSCCELAEPRDGEPALVAAARGCPCALVLPAREVSPATAPRTCEARNPLRSELERGQRVVELGWSALAPRPIPDAHPPARIAETGPPGSERARGAARAAALGALLL